MPTTKSPIRWPGGKSRVAARIVAALPEHETYVEACCGGAAVFWAKPREASQAEVLNDRDGELINFYQVLHRRGRRLVREVDAMPYSRALFARMFRWRPRARFARARRFWYLNRVSFAAIGRTFGVKKQRRAWVLPARILASLDRTVERLRGVSFESLDLCRCIELYDGAKTCFYVDPPYVEIHGLYRVDFDDAPDHERLATALRRARGAWVLSYNDHPLVRRLYDGCHLVDVELRYSIRGPDVGYRQTGRHELIISNRALA